MTRLCAAVLLTGLWWNATALAADKYAAGQEVKAAGIVFDKKNDWILVKLDGEDEATKFFVANDADKKLAEALKPIFSVSRVQLTYKIDGEARQLLSIKRQVIKSLGTVTGLVVKSYGWWVEVKPTVGVSDGYAAHFPFEKHQDVMNMLKELKPGDSVTITFTTDFERHRIKTLRKNTRGTTPSESPSKN